MRRFALICQTCLVGAMMNPKGLMTQMTDREHWSQTRERQNPIDDGVTLYATLSNQAQSGSQEGITDKITADVGVRKSWWAKMGARGRTTAYRSPLKDFEAFRVSALAEEWIVFALAWILLFRLSLHIESLECTTWWHHMACLSLWVGTAMMFLAFTCLNWGREYGEIWANGYTMELILSMENVFLYEIILVSFKVPARLARYALFVTSICQMLFQMFLFMGMAAYIQRMDALPYLLGAWLIFVAWQTMKDNEHEAFDAASSESYNAFRLAMGDRLLPGYSSEGSVFVVKDERLCVTMLGPVIVCLLLVMFVMEVDVTLTKIEEIPNHFIAWSSSVFAAFALPELFVVVRELLRRFYLLKFGISFLLLFFGAMLMFRKAVKVSDTSELVIMVVIVLGSMVLSPILGYSERSGEMYVQNFPLVKDDASPLNAPPGCQLLERAAEDTKTRPS